MRFANLNTHGAVRPPAVAGRFYPGRADELRALIQSFLAEARKDSELEAGVSPKAVIMPHAGYVYSGPIAAAACVPLAAGRGRIQRVILIGPAHYVSVAGVAASSAAAFATPLGDVRVDQAMVSRLVAANLVTLSDETHAPEHALEVELPFLQTVLGDFMLVPLVVGDASVAQVSRVLEAVWGGGETLIVVSSDLSHYHDAGTAEKLDRVTARAIEQLQPQRLGPADACGRLAIAGLLTVAAARGLQAHRLDLRNSGDTAGPHDRVVGYGAFAFFPAGQVETAATS